VYKNLENRKILWELDKIDKELCQYIKLEIYNNFVQIGKIFFRKKLKKATFCANSANWKILKKLKRPRFVPIRQIGILKK